MGRRFQEQRLKDAKRRVNELVDEVMVYNSMYVEQESFGAVGRMVRKGTIAALEAQHGFVFHLPGQVPNC